MKGKKSITDREGFHNFWKATHCSFGFFLHSLAAGSVSALQSLTLAQSGYEKLGFFNMAIFYLMYGAGSLFAKSLMQRVGP